MSNRSRQTIAIEKLKELGKLTLEVPNSDLYLHDDLVVVVRSHVRFLEAVAGHTKRLNACAVGLMGRDLFQLGPRESQLFGDAMAKAFAHCIGAGSKAVTGQKLAKEVHRVYLASVSAGASSCKSEGVKPEATTTNLKREPDISSPQPSKKFILQKCLSSPTAISALYGGASSSGASSSGSIKVIQCIYIYIYYIYKFIYKHEHAAKGYIKSVNIYIYYI